MKDWFLQLKINKLKNNNSVHTNIAFQNAQKIGFLFSSIDEFNKHKHLVNELKTKIPKIHVLIQVADEKKQKSSEKLFSKKDFSFFGAVNSKNINDFCIEKFDYLLYFEKNKTKLIQYILLKSNAKCRIGYFLEGDESFFDLMFDLKTTPQEIIRKLAQIKVNE